MAKYSNLTIPQALKGYETALRTLRDVYQRDVLSSVSGLIDNAVLSGDIKRAAQYKNLADYLTQNQGDLQAIGKLEKFLARASEEKIESIDKEGVAVETAPRRRRHKRRRYWTVDETIDAIKAEDKKRWHKERTRPAYYQKIMYAADKEKFTTLKKDGKITRFCIAQVKALLPELTQYSPRD